MAKMKADRLFADAVPKDAPSGDEPRAALYKGKMGSSHKKSSKMQAREKSGSGFSLPFSIPLPKFDSKGSVALLVCACLVVSCLLLYDPVKHYYIAVRDQARAELEYEIASTRNEALRQDVALLATDGGMEERARQQYGWVKDGENAVLVAGLSEDDGLTPAEVLRTTTMNDIHAPETWYSPVLDKVFGYER